MDKTSLAAQWLRLYASSVGGTGSIPDHGTHTPRSVAKTKTKPTQDSLLAFLCPTNRAEDGTPSLWGDLTLKTMRIPCVNAHLLWESVFWFLITFGR